MEITPTLPKYQTQNYTVTSKVQYNCNNVFRKNPTNTIPHTSDDTRCHLNLLNISQLNFASILTTLHESCRTKSKPIFHAGNKNLFLKTPFDFRHLTSSSFKPYLPYKFSEGLKTLSEETTQRKHTYVTTIFLATNKPTSPAKIILQKYRPKILPLKVQVTVFRNQTYKSVFMSQNSVECLKFSFFT